MNQKNIAIAGFVLGMNKPIEIPERLREFLTTDGMDGINDLDFMISNPKLCRRIPTDVRAQYEVLYCQLSEEIDEICNNLEQQIADMRSKPKEYIHVLIQQSLEHQE